MKINRLSYYIREEQGLTSQESLIAYRLNLVRMRLVELTGSRIFTVYFRIVFEEGGFIVYDGTNVSPLNEVTTEYIVLGYIYRALQYKTDSRDNVYTKIARLYRWDTEDDIIFLMEDD